MTKKHRRPYKGTKGGITFCFLLNSNLPCPSRREQKTRTNKQDVSTSNLNHQMSANERITVGIGNVYDTPEANTPVDPSQHAFECFKRVFPLKIHVVRGYKANVELLSHTHTQTHQSFRITSTLYK